MGLIHLVVSTLSGKIIPIVIEEEGATIQKVKEALTKAEGINIKYQCLSIGGKICMNKESIKHYGIRNNTRLNVAFPIREGSFNPEDWRWGVNPRPIGDELRAIQRRNNPKP